MSATAPITLPTKRLETQLAAKLVKLGKLEAEIATIETSIACRACPFIPGDRITFQRPGVDSRKQTGTVSRILYAGGRDLWKAEVLRDHAITAVTVRAFTNPKLVEVSMKGIQVGVPTANRNAVRVLLSGTEAESLKWVRHHAENAEWLKLAMEIERDKTVRFSSVRKFIQALLSKLEVAL